MAELAKKLISKTTLTSDQSSVVFSSIPQSYTSLILIFSVRTTNLTAMANNATPNAAMNITFNEQNSGTNCGSMYFRSYSTDVYTNYTYPNRPNLISTYYNQVGDVLTDGDLVNSFTAGIINMNNYSKTNQNKMFYGHLGSYSTSTGSMSRCVGTFASQTGISTITLSPVSGLIKSNSSFSLYGITTA
jgi:hypothetical protein